MEAYGRSIKRKLCRFACVTEHRFSFDSAVLNAIFPTQTFLILLVLLWGFLQSLVIVKDIEVEKAAIFVDVQNIYYTTKHTFSRSFNYRQFWQSIATDYEITYAFAYAIDRGDVQQQKFQSALRHIGFDVKLKPFIQRADGSAKGDWDVGITIDVLDVAPHVDTIILLSGDGDFDRLLTKTHQEHNCKTTVFGVRKLTANSLISASCEFVEIDTKWLL
jgi:uncharacterized LabA/DUF88 family protein